jgi:hypothetical protein
VITDPVMICLEYRLDTLDLLHWPSSALSGLVDTIRHEHPTELRALLPLANRRFAQRQLWCQGIPRQPNPVASTSTEARANPNRGQLPRSTLSQAEYGSCRRWRPTDGDIHSLAWPGARRSPGHHDWCQRPRAHRQGPPAVNANVRSTTYTDAAKFDLGHDPEQTIRGNRNRRTVDPQSIVRDSGRIRLERFTMSAATIMGTYVGRRLPGPPRV